MDNYLGMTESTLTALTQLKEACESVPNLSEEEFIRLRNKYLSVSKVKWIKHIYGYTDNSNEKDSKYEFLNVCSFAVLPVIIERFSKIKANWDEEK